MYIRGTRQRRCVRTVSRKWRAEPSHMASVAPPARIWDGSPHDSRTVCRRSSRVRAPPPPKVPSGDSGGGGGCIGSFADFGVFLGPIGGALRFCIKPSTFGQKIFFAQTAMSSDSSAPEVYQKIFFEFFCRVWMARSALARTAPCGQVWDTKSSKYPLLGAVWPCFDPFENLAETSSS